jgi:hypothetical protein
VQKFFLQFDSDWGRRNHDTRPVEKLVRDFVSDEDESSDLLVLPAGVSVAVINWGDEEATATA